MANVSASTRCESASAARQIVGLLWNLISRCCDCWLAETSITSTVMFQVQITRNKDQYSFYEASEEADRRLNLGVRHLWLDYLGSHTNSDLAMRYYDFVRDMFYTRVSFRNFNFQFLHNLVSEAKLIIDQVNERVSPEFLKSTAE